MKKFLSIPILFIALLFLSISFISAAPTTEGLVSHWKLDELTSGGEDSVIDSTDQNNHGTPLGAAGDNNKPQPSADVPDVSFSNPRSLDFDGTDDVVTTQYSPVYSTGDSFSWSLWLKTDTNQSGKGVFSARDTNKPGDPLAEIYLVSGQIQGLFRGADGIRKDLTYTMNYADNVWHNITIVIDNGSGILYVDGVERDTISDLNMNIDLSDVAVPIGASNYENSVQRFFNGNIDDVRVYDRALSAGEVSELSGKFPISENFNDAQPDKWILKQNAAWQATVDGQETLRLTTAAVSQAGLGYYDTAFDSDSGIVAEFDYYAAEGSGADGLSFFLVDGNQVNVDNIEPGAFGSSLGYAQSGATPGVPYAYLGVGFDEYGGFVSAGGGKTGLGSPAPDSVVLRGSGNGTTGYDYLTHTQVSAAPISQTIDGGWRRARISVTPEESSAIIRVEMSWDDGDTWHTVIDDYEYAETPPDFLKLGFTAGTGGSTNIHAIDNLEVSIPSDLVVAVTSTLEDSYRYGNTVEYTYTVTNNGPNSAGDVTITNDMPIGDTGFSSVTWSYTSSDEETGSGDETDIDSMVISIDDGEVVTVTVQATVGSAVNATTNLDHTISASPGSGYIDPSPSSANVDIDLTTTQTWEEDLIAYWRFDEGSGTTAYDSTENRHNGTISGATYSPITSSEIAFENSHSLEFDGIDDGITTPLSINNFPTFTLAGWAYPRSAVPSVGWFGANDVFEFIFDGEDELRCWTPQGAVNWTFDPETFLNEWHHITCLGDGTKVVLYVDGEEVGSTSHEFTNNYGSGDNFSIGIGVQNGGSSGPFDGYIDDVRVYDRALTPDEMFSLGTGAEEPQEGPIVSTLSPQNEELIEISEFSTFVISFNKVVNVGSGNITLIKKSGNSIIETIDVTSEQISGSGTNTITITPNAEFEGGTEYYITIDSGAFVDESETGFAGIIDSTGWTFHTEELPPEPTPTPTPEPTPTPTPEPTTSPEPSSEPSKSTDNSSSKSSTSVCTAKSPSGTPDLFQISVTNNSATVYFAPLAETNEYYISYATSYNAEEHGVSAALDSSGVQSYTLSSLQPGTTYYFKVRGQNDCATGDWSSVKSAVTLSVSNQNNFTQLQTTQLSVTGVSVSNQSTSNNSDQCTYVVQSGDNLWNISQEVLGSGDRYQDLIAQNQETYPQISSGLRTGWELSIPCSKDEENSTDEAANQGISDQDTHDVRIKVTHDGKPLAGANIELHSNPKYGTTNEDGEVFFEGVEKGTHTLKIAYQNYNTEQKLQVEGDAQAFDVSVNVTLTETGIPYNWAFAAVGLAVVAVGFLLLLVRRKSQEDER